MKRSVPLKLDSKGRVGYFDPDDVSSVVPVPGGKDECWLRMKGQSEEDEFTIYESAQSVIQLLHS